MKTLEESKKAYQTLGKEGFELTYDLETRVARLNRVSKRSTFGVKAVWAYRFKSIEEMTKYISNDFDNRKASIEKNISSKQERKEKNKVISDGIQVGDIFCYSWGFEQTNVDFYQVVEKPSKATIIIRPIGHEVLETCSWASEYVRPVKDAFIGERSEKVRLSGSYFKRSCGYATKIDNPKTSKHYHSWYA